MIPLISWLGTLWPVRLCMALALCLLVACRSPISTLGQLTVAPHVSSAVATLEGETTYRLRLMLPEERRERRLLALPLSWDQAVITLNSPTARTQPYETTLPRASWTYNAAANPPYWEAALALPPLRPAADYTVTAKLEALGIPNVTKASGTLVSQSVVSGANLLTVMLWGSNAYELRKGPNQIAIDASGNAWISIPDSDRVSKLSSTGAYLAPALAGDRPFGLAADSAGNVWVASYLSDALTKLSSAGAVLATYSLGAGSRPVGVAIDGSGNVWVTCSGANTVKKVRASDGVVLGTYTVGTTPHYPAIDGSGNIWVPNHGSNNVTKLRASDGAVLGTYAAGSGPSDVAFDSSGNAWLTNWAAGTGTTVTKLSSTGTLLGTYDVGSVVHSIAIDAGGNAWVTIYGPGGTGTTVKKLSATGAVLGTYAAGDGPTGVAIDGSGIVWVVNFSANGVTRLDATGMTVGTNWTGTHLSDIAIDSFGNAWAPDYALGMGTTVSKLDFSGRVLANYAAGTGALHVAIDASDNVWVGNYKSPGTVTKLSRAGATLGAYGVGNYPRGIAIDGAGNVWVANYGAGGAGTTVTKLRGSDGVLLGTYTVASGPFGIATDASGNAWVTHWANGTGSTVTKLSSTGATLGTFTVPAAPFDVAIDPSGNAWVTHINANSLSKLSSSGTVLGTYATGGNGSRQVAIDAAGNAWVTNTNSKSVGKLSPSGVLLDTYPVGFMPLDVAIDQANTAWVVNGGGNSVTKLRPRIPYGIDFDGVDDTARTANEQGRLDAITGTFTMELWAKPTATHEIDTEATTGGSGASGQRYLIWAGHGLTSGKVGAGVSMGTNGISVYEHTGGYMPALLVYSGSFTDWTHVAVVYNANRPSLYVNGTLVRTGLQSSQIVVPTTWLGNDTTYGCFAGQAGEFRVWNYARTGAQIKATMHKELLGSESGLVGYWKFQEGASSTIRDRTAAVNHLTTNVGANGTGAFWIERP